jgi:hypothetical protein
MYVASRIIEFEQQHISTQETDMSRLSIYVCS